MFLAHLGKEVGGWPGTSGFYVFMAPADTFNSFLEILALPFQIGSQSLIKRDGRVLPTPLGVFLQLRLAFRLEGYHVHDLPIGYGPRHLIDVLKRKRQESTCQARLRLKRYPIFFDSDDSCGQPNPEIPQRQFQPAEIGMVVVADGECYVDGISGE